MTAKRILVGLGGTEFTPVAIQRAIELARLLRAGALHEKGAYTRSRRVDLRNSPGGP